MATVTYRLEILPSPSNFVEKVEIHALINNVPTLIAGELPSSTTQVQYDFPVDASVEWWGRWIGDNNTQKDCAHRVFIAANLEQVQAGLAVGEAFLRFNP